MLASRLVERTTDLDAADACHAATALHREIPVLVDRGFDTVEGLRRLDPVEAVAQL